MGHYSYKYSGTVIGIDGCVYGIPYHSYRILKYDPINEITSSVGGDVFDIRCGDGVLGKDMYAATDDGKVLKIDATNNSHRFVGIQVKSEHLSVSTI